jgi:hypothetical protein
MGTSSYLYTRNTQRLQLSLTPRTWWHDLSCTLESFYCECFAPEHFHETVYVAELSDTCMLVTNACMVVTTNNNCSQQARESGGVYIYNVLARFSFSGLARLVSLASFRWTSRCPEPWRVCLAVIWASTDDLPEQLLGSRLLELSKYWPLDNGRKIGAR